MIVVGTKMSQPAAILGGARCVTAVVAQIGADQAQLIGHGYSALSYA